MWLISLIWKFTKKKIQESTVEETFKGNNGVITEFTSAIRQVMADCRETNRESTKEVVSSLYAVRDEIKELVQSNQLTVNSIVNLRGGQDRVEQDVRFMRHNWPPRNGH